MARISLKEQIPLVKRVSNTIPSREDLKFPEKETNESGIVYFERIRTHICYYLSTAAVAAFVIAIVTIVIVDRRELSSSSMTLVVGSENSTVNITKPIISNICNPNSYSNDLQKCSLLCFDSKFVSRLSSGEYKYPFPFTNYTNIIPNIISECPGYYRSHQSLFEVNPSRQKAINNFSQVIDVPLKFYYHCSLLAGLSLSADR